MRFHIIFFGLVVLLLSSCANCATGYSSVNGQCVPYGATGLGYGTYGTTYAGTYGTTYGTTYGAAYGTTYAGTYGTTYGTAYGGVPYH